ncbi:MAG: ECF-type sigma factor, partial [Actinomycetota bacterium]
RGHFFAIASRILRRIVVDEARSLWAEKRGGDVQKISLAELGDVGLGGRPDEVLAVEACLQELERQSPERARLVELRFFAGLSLEETAEVLGQSRATTVRQWRVTKGWLSQELEHGLPRLPRD